MPDLPSDAISNGQIFKESNPEPRQRFVIWFAGPIARCTIDGGMSTLTSLTITRISIKKLLTLQ